MTSEDYTFTQSCTVVSNTTPQAEEVQPNKLGFFLLNTRSRVPFAHNTGSAGKSAHITCNNVTYRIEPKALKMEIKGKGWYIYSDVLLYTPPRRRVITLSRQAPWLDGPLQKRIAQSPPAEKIEDWAQSEHIRAFQATICSPPRRWTFIRTPWAGFRPASPSTSSTRPKTYSGSWWLETPPPPRAISSTAASSTETSLEASRHFKPTPYPSSTQEFMLIQRFTPSFSTRPTILFAFCEASGYAS